MAANTRRDEVEQHLKSRRMADTAKKVAISAAVIIAKAAVGSPGPEIVGAIIEQLRGAFKIEPAIMERFVDEMSDAGSMNEVVSRFFRSACAVTQDSAVLLKMLKTLSGIDAPWLVFNEESTHLLAHSNINWGRWLRGYKALEQKIDVTRRPGALGVYSCLSKDFTTDAYLSLTRQNRLSAISRNPN